MSTIRDPRKIWLAFRPSPYPKPWLCSLCFPFQPLLAGGRRKWLGHFSTGSCVFCGFLFLFFISFPSYVALWDSPQTRLWEGFPLFGNFSSFRLPPQNRSSSLTLLSLLLFFIFCPTSFPREWAAFLDAWCPPPAFRSCFGEVAQHSNDILMNLCRRKWSPRPILPPSLDHPLFVFISF